MLKNYLLIALRNIIKNKGYSLTNIIGLALGMVVASVILFLIIHELSYDMYQKEVENTYMIYTGSKTTNKFTAYTPFVLATTLKNNFPELETVAQIRFLNGDINISNGKDYFKIENCCFADPETFNLFTFSFIAGNVQLFSSKPNSALLSQSTVKKYFTNEKDVIGKTIEIKNYSNIYLVEVSGIYYDVPENSQFKPEIILNMKLLKDLNRENLSNWNYNNFATFVHLKKNVDKNNFISKANNIINSTAFNSSADQNKIDYRFLPLTDVHLYASDIDGVFGKKGNINKIYIYITIGFLTLLIACINFINISIAKSAAKAKDIAVRKVVGADRRGIIFQLLIESLVVSFLSIPVTLILFEFIKPVAVEYFDRSFRINYFDDWKYLISYFSMILLVGMLSGIYSALITSKSAPTDILRKKNQMKSSKSYFRLTLITFQFIVFTGMLICCFVIYEQMKFIQNTDLGYKKENLFVVNLPNYKFDSECESFINELKQNPHIINASITSSVPPSLGNRITTTKKSIVRPGEITEYQFIECDENYKSVLGLEMKEGRFFNRTMESNGILKVVINETAKKEMGLKFSLGENIELLGQKMQIIGVVKDFHINSFYDPIIPIIFQPTKYNLAAFVFKLDGKNTLTTINDIKTNWEKFFPASPFSFKFVDEEINKIYKTDLSFGALITFFTIIATLIAVLGLSGLTAFTSSQRVKEIGIRKVLGASTRGIMILLAKEIIMVSLISCIIAFPIAHYFMKKWLTTFVYKTEITFDVFIMAITSTLVVALLTVCFQSLKAALANPVESLKYE